MVRRHSKEDKFTFDAPIEQRTLVPWKQLASTPPVDSSDTHRKSKYVFDFLEDPPGKDGHHSRPKTSSSFKGPESKDSPKTPAAEEEQDVQEEFERPKSREVSPIQEKLLLEQYWQKNLIQIDELLSDYSAPNKGEFNQAIFLEAFKNKDVLNLFFKLFDWDNLGRVPQEKIIECARRTFLGQGGLEFVELIEVVIYVICEDRDVTTACFFKIFNSRGIVEKFFRYIKEELGKTGSVTRQMIMDLIANLTYARPRETFSEENLERLEKLFKAALGTKQELTFEDFKKIVHSRNSFFAERVFHIFDRDKSGSISLSEFIDAMHQFTGKSADDKIKFLFRVYDLDGDGLIQLEELEQVMKACMEENGMKFSNEQIEDLTIALFEDADTEQRGAITCEALKAQLEKHPGLLENLSVSIDRWLIPPPPEIKKPDKLAKLKHLFSHHFSLSYLKNNYVYLFFLLFFIAVNAGLFIDRALTIYNQGHNVLYILARASGQCLNFNCTFILILILRNSLTFLRSHGAAAFLPLDQHLFFHKMCGWVVFFHSSLHTLMHLINFPLNVVHSPSLNPKGLTAAQWLLTAEPGAFGLVKGWANPTGIILMVILIIMVICSLPFVRKSGYFEVFYWTHLLYIVFWGLTILHGPHFYKWFVGPAFIFIIEKLYRVCKTQTQKGKTYISAGILLPSKVIHLVIQKPQGFTYHPGDYVFVNIPAIAKYEWHPFTISSAPEKDGAIWLHIRAVGEWTNRLYSYFENQQIECEKRPASGKLSIQYSNSKSVAIKMDSTTLQYEKNSVTKFVGKALTGNAKRTEGFANESFEKGNELGGNNRDSFAQNNSELDERKIRGKSSLLSTDRIDPMNAEISPLQRSAMMSIRYMRRKPPVVNLDLPDSEDDTDSEDETLPSDDVEAAPKSTAVRRASGQIFDRRSSNRGTKSKRKKSRGEIRRISRLKEAEEHGQCTLGKPLVIYIDGPYGTPSSHIFRAQHAVLIGTGIGVTPFASILQSIMQRYLKARQTCPRCEYSWTGDIPPTVMNLRKVDFFWINRDQRSFEWFVNLLSQLEIEQAEQGGFLERFLDMNMYITSALQKTDMKAVGLQLALDLLHEKEKRDLITGLKTRTNAGRPNWDKVFKQLANQKKGKVTVFYCGPPTLGRTLRYKCIEYGFEFRKEIF